MATRILIADDEELVRTGFRMILEAEEDFEVLGEASNGTEVVEMARSLQPEVILMDIRMPGMDGLEATRQIGESGKTRSSRVLILTTFDQDEYVYGALRAGSSGFLLKRTHAPTLVEGIRVIADGDALLAPSVTRRLIDQFARSPEPGKPQAKAPQPAGTRGARSSRPGLVQRRVCRAALHERGHRQDARETHLHQARPPRPHSGGHLRLRGGHGRAQEGLTDGLEYLIRRTRLPAAAVCLSERSEGPGETGWPSLTRWTMATPTWDATPPQILRRGLGCCGVFCG